MVLSDVCLLCTSGLSREQRPRKTKIGTDAAHLRRDSDTIFTVKRSKGNVTGAEAYCGGLPHSLCGLSLGLVVQFLLKTGFWPSYCRMSTDLDKTLHTPIVVRNTLVGRLRPRSAQRVRGSRPNQNDYVFCNTCNAPQVLYRDDGSSRFRRQTIKVEARTGDILKN